jgi:CheY-specific phosphatase CheX
MTGKGTASHAFSLMQRHLESATGELFGDYGIRLERSTSERIRQSAGDSVAAMIGYVGHQMRGALVLLASVEVIRQWQAAVGGLDPGLDVSDTLCEFSNMLLGRLKSHLLAEGMPILMCTPTAAFGRGLSLAPGQGVSAQFAFECPGWDFRIRLNATFDSDFTWTHSAPYAPPAIAGDVMLF